jgi:iron complex transport system ATP-binding protein
MTIDSSFAAPLLEASHLSYAYTRGTPVVRDVSLNLAHRSLTAIIGANGSGKSTLVRMLAGLLRPTTGAIRLRGTPLHDWEPRLRAREIAYVPQSTSVVFPLKAADLVLSGRSPYTPRFRMETQHDAVIVARALESAGAAHLMNRHFTSLSGGERQMVVLARALAQEPRLLVLDEPSSSLDLAHRATLMRTLMRLRETENLSVVMVTHDLQMIGSRFDQVIAMRCGSVAAAGRPEEVLREAALREVFEDARVRTQQVDDQTLVWVDL